MNRQTRKPAPNRGNTELGPDQESVWDYPRPPALDRVGQRVRIVLGDICIAETTNALRILETSHPPTVYIPMCDILQDVLVDCTHQTFCEWKGVAHYYDVVGETSRVGRAAWYYPTPKEKYSELLDHVAFYPSLMQACYVGDELVASQQGDFYGGWITSKIVGPYKGGPGTVGW